MKKKLTKRNLRSFDDSMMPKLVVPGLGDGQTPLQFLLSVVRDETKELADRVKCACAALPYCHPRMADSYVGKKEIEAHKAKSVEAGGTWGNDLADQLPN